MSAADTIRSFRLSESFLDEYRDKQPAWGFNGLGYVVCKRTYARTKLDGTLEEFWETCKRVVEGTYDTQKKHCKSLRLPWDDRKAQRSAQEMFRRMWAFKWLPPGRGLWMMGSPAIERLGGAALNNPLHVDTRILTKEHGWSRLGDLAGESITVLSSPKKYGRDESSGTAASATWTLATVSQIEHQPSLQLTLQHYNGTEFTITASENHRWFRRSTTKKPWERVTSVDLCVGDYLPVVRPAKNYPLSLFGAQHGLFFGDGTRPNGELHQFSTSVDVLRSLFGDKAEQITHRREDEWVVRNCPKSWGSLPPMDSDHSYIYGFLAGYFAADGCVSEAGNLTLSSARKEELDNVCALFKHIGVRTTPVRLSSTSSNFSDDRELWVTAVYKYDVAEDFFLKEEHRARWVTNQSSRRVRDYAKVVAVTSVGIQPVICATVPEFEQFVTEGFVMTSNCGFVSTKGIAVDFADPFCWLMDMLMLGVGIGFDTKGAGLVKIQAAQMSDTVFVVEDSREGWVSLLRLWLDAYVGKGALPKVVDYSKVRPFGAPINGFGGVASGPDPLKELVYSVTKILEPLHGQTITSTAIVDICNLIGRCVVAGNVRRSAEIAFGDPGDSEFLNLKNPDINKDALMHHRWASNNSIFATVGMDYSTVANMTAKNGEPGYQWLDNAREYGRMGGLKDYSDMRVAGANPCVEQSLEDRELCCLVETFPGLHETFEDYKKTLKYAYLYAKTVTLMPTHDDRTNMVTMRNRRIGCSMSGITQAMQKFGRRNFLSQFCDQGYHYLRELDQVYSDWLCVRTSIKITSVKPSGTVSLLAGVTPGIHFPHAKYYIRRVRLQDSSPLVSKLEAAGYPIEDDQYSPNTKVVSFPVEERDFDRNKDDVTIWEQLELAAQIQQFWADNQVSVTVTFKSSEAKDIKYALELYETRLKGVSFLPLEEHGYAQAPYETISEDTYRDMIAHITSLDTTDATHEQTSRFCDGESCTI